MTATTNAVNPAIRRITAKTRARRKMTDDQVRDARARFWNRDDPDGALATLAAEFGVSITAVSEVVHGRTYRDVS